MGCDIHAFIDYKENDYVRNFAEVNIGRDYALFTVLAGVRSYGDTKVKMFEPKGLPKKVSYQVEDKYTLFVVEDSEYFDYETWCKRSDADKWVNSGSSKYWDKNRVTGPDWHSASWLNTKELKLAYKRYRNYFTQSVMPELRPDMNDEDWTKEMERTEDLIEPVSPNLEVEAVIGSMERLDKFGAKSMFIFWFDN